MPAGQTRHVMPGATRDATVAVRVWIEAEDPHLRGRVACEALSFSEAARGVDEITRLVGEALRRVERSLRPTPCVATWPRREGDAGTTSPV